MKHTAKPKHQHWVPQFYLRNFANDEADPQAEPQIWATDLTQTPSVTRTPTIRNVCGKHFMYTPKAHDTSREWALDDQLGRIETKAAEAWPDLMGGELQNLDAAVRDHVAAFIGALHLRNYYLLELTSSAMTLRDQLYGRPEGNTSGKWALGHPDPSDPTRTFANSVAESLPRIASTIAAKSWCVTVSKQGEFLTSDRPVVLRQVCRRRPAISDHDTTWVLPLSPNRALVMYGKIGEHQRSALDLDANLIATLNLLQALHCNRFVLSHVDPRSLLTLRPFEDIQKHRTEMRAKRQSRSI